MSSQTLNLTPNVYRYLLTNSLREDPVLTKLRQETAKLPTAIMQISPEQGQFMALLVKLMGAKKTIDIGTYTGYSAMVVAQALPQDGQVIACDTSVEFTEIAQRFWIEGEVQHKVKLHLGPASDTLQKLIKDQAETFDFIFIDADKRGYKNYYGQALQLLRKGGLIAIDNVLQDGRVADAMQQDAITQAIRDFNQHLLNDKGIFLSMIPIGDGLTVALKI